jgi:hypothetical protein
MMPGSDAGVDRRFAKGSIMRLLLPLTLLVIVALGSRSASAQVSSPAASPTTACRAPSRSAGTPTTGASLPTIATPDQGAAPVGTPADPALIARVVAAEENLQHCMNAGRYDVVIALHAPEAVPALFGTSDPQEAAAMLEGFPPLETVALEHVQVLPDGRLSVEATFRQGEELMRWRDYWIERDGELLYAGYDVLAVAPSTPTP